MRDVTTRDQESSVSCPTIGVIRSPFHEQAGTPIQPVYAADAVGEVEVLPEYQPALRDLDGFDRIWLLYQFHRAGAYQPRVVPFRDNEPRGLFATRAPTRPIPIGLSVVELLSIERNVLRVRGIDVLDGTPLLDIKPYVPAFDAHPGSRAGWFDEQREDRREADGRFHGST